MNGFIRYFSAVKARFKLKNYLTYFIFLAFILIFAPLGLTGSLKMSTEFMLEQIGYSIVAAISLSLVVGFLGELSLGHAGFMSIGAMVGALLQNKLYPSLSASSPFLALVIAMIVGGLAAAVFGFIIGLPALRLKGDYLAIVTLAFCQIVQTIFEQLPFFGGTLGIANAARYSSHKLFIVIFVVALISLVAINNFIKSKHGRAVMAIRDNEIAARAMGVNVSFNKIFVFVFSSFIAGIAGVLMAASKNTVAANAFTYNYSIDILVMVVLGGMGNINGSIVAATLITVLNISLNNVFTGSMAAIKNIVYALVLILIVIYTNAPGLKSFREKHGFGVYWSKFTAKIVKLFSKKELKQDPAKEKEFGADWSKVPTKVEMDAILSTDLTPDKSYVSDKPAPDGKTDGSGKGDK